MRTLHRNKAKLLLLFSGTLILYNEFLTYLLQSMFNWPSISCYDQSSCIKVLLVADPQILGEQYEGRFPIGTVARWDCDRFLRKTFQQAVSHVDPDVVIFLGDIMDEGSIATREEYTRYTYRFFDIFETNKLIQYIYLPGDNDIGGEDDDRLTSEKIKRYDKTFTQPDSFRIKSVDFYKVNRLTMSIPKNISAEEKRINVALTHLPLLFLPNQFVQKVVKQLRPQVIFSAHEHKSYTLHAPVSADVRKDDQYVETLLPSGGPSWLYHLSNSVIHEILVPTCSYRMGVRHVGYGVAVFDGKEQMEYSVLWSPSRFNHLRMYLGMLICVVFYYSIWSCLCVCLRIRKKVINTKFAV